MGELTIFARERPNRTHRYCDCTGWATYNLELHRSPRALVDLRAIEKLIL